MLDDLAREGREAGERPGSLADAQARIAEALARLDAVAPGALDAGSARPVTLEPGAGLVFDRATTTRGTGRCRNSTSTS
ncbi:hypothetical protein [Methylobacterium sp. 17Sr1-1]|uniref:hypothetical protein n=1 Tax=Methylobacterium sp. 17Sr1-1 TaxID=2202826 RepID=UPI0019509F2B|nr:hypothetical protein [Methylobacterium sp. 17Sr1-1]